MLNLNKPYLITTGMLLCLAFFPLAAPTSFEVDQTLSPVFENFPVEIAGWKGTDSEVDQLTYEILETKNVLSRIYQNGQGDYIHLLLVASHKDRRVAHPPEVCYISSNYEILQENDYRIKTRDQDIPVREFLAKSERTPSETQQVLYLYKIGDKLTTNYYAQQIQFAWDQFTRKESEVFLIRIAGNDQASLQSFLPKVLEHLNP